MIELQNISFSYTCDKKILDNINVRFDRGNVYSIVGASGTGKSTLLSVIAGIEKPQSGAVLFDGQQSDFTDVLRKYDLSIIFQNYMLFDYMNAVENVVTAMNIRFGKDKKAKEKAIKFLTDLGFDKRDMHRPMKKISGGQQQRVAIARAIACKSQYILADEPTGNLDEDTAMLIMDLFRKIAKEYDCAIIIVTHSMQVKQKSDFAFKLTRGSLMSI